MDFISLVFRLGVVLAIFSFIWGLLRLGLTILRGGTPLSYPVNLSLKMIQYFIIADITILFCETKSDSLQLDLVLSGLILLMYFIGKVQNMKTKLQFITIQTRGLNDVHKPNMNLEFGVIVLSMGLFIFLAIKQEYAINPVSTWFYTTITDIEKTPIFGFIFKIIGFFFTINMLLKMFAAFTMLLSGRAFNKPKDDNNNNGPDDNPYHFDDYEEVK
ncbi:MAG: hypothetical protein A3D31_17445 [Candidatus Fluviicola riflensis]|nr:MAG: hypothetical protein CHH17_02385 [Candidatus Fluviicola riflensis]OGS76770.1 MAG: hypothetical protein A3D31_17445 [Candidatus Fluviicola riflensis]OGS82875.1 MAG: hypothetical protein A2724_13915 [Fluviicola sp. RIFCSPHIGHO2_01_FULL_43_53]OGS88500.1 MAG: hypothetical protein A3E30_06950 [Fluviicola sp. RIFCSPHIGHO2_12_FULL_43_24]